MRKHETTKLPLHEMLRGGALLKGVTLIEYVLLISCVSLVICLAGPPVADAIQGQFGKVEEVISNGTSGGSGGGGGDFPGGGSGHGGSDQGGTDDKTDSDGDGIPDSQDKYPNDPNNGNGDKDGDGIPDKDDAYPDDPNNGVKPDADGDGIPDDEDAYPDDPLNGTGDKDGDGIMDKDDPYPDDPLNGKDPAVTGSIGISPANPTVGTTLTVIESGLPSGNKTYTWKNGDGQLVSSSNCYTTTDADASKTVSVEVKVDGYDGTLTASASIARKQMTGSIEITEAYVGYPVKFNYSIPSGARAGLKWHLVQNGQDTVVSESSNYTPEAALAGKASVYLEMYDKNGQFEGSIYSVEMELTAKKLSEVASLTISKAEVGASVAYSFSGPTTSGASWKYEWSIDGAVKSSASTFTPTADMEGKTLTLSISDASGNFTGKVSATAVVKPENLDNIPDSSVGGTVVLKYNKTTPVEVLDRNFSFTVNPSFNSKSIDGKVVTTSNNKIVVKKSGTYKFSIAQITGTIDPQSDSFDTYVQTKYSLNLKTSSAGNLSFGAAANEGWTNGGNSYKYAKTQLNEYKAKDITVFLTAGSTIEVVLSGSCGYNHHNSNYAIINSNLTLNISKVG